jgi:hypothetical protein
MVLLASLVFLGSAISWAETPRYVREASAEKTEPRRSRDVHVLQEAIASLGHSAVIQAAAALRGTLGIPGGWRIILIVGVFRARKVTLLRSKPWRAFTRSEYNCRFVGKHRSGRMQ